MALSKKMMYAATKSNYIHLLIKIVVSLFLVRIMFLGMGGENYGFWALLWSIFGYSVLLEFGLGVTIQKKSAEFMEAGEIYKISSLFSTYLFVYLLLSLVIMATTVILSFNIDVLFVLQDKSKLEAYSLALLVFGIGSALSFSLGFVDEILRGLHLIKIRNCINTIFILLNALLLWLCVVTNQPIYMYALAAVSVQALNNFSFLIVLKKEIKDLKISFALVDLLDVKNSMKFSLSAYLVMLSNIIIFRTDQIVISVIAGVSFAGFYQIAARVSELFRQFATQFHESLGTKAAMLNEKKHQKELSALLLHSNKLIAMVATALFIPAYLLIEPLLHQWLNLSDKMTIDTARILLVSMYVLVVFRSSMVQILLMNGKHVQLMRVGLLEAIANVLLSIFLVREYGMIGAAVGTLIPNVLFALFYNIPVSLRYTSTRLSVYTKAYVLPLIISVGLVFYMGSALLTYITPDSIGKLLIDGMILLFSFLLIYRLPEIKKKRKNSHLSANYLRSSFL